MQKVNMLKINHYTEDGAKHLGEVAHIYDECHRGRHWTLCGASDEVAMFHAIQVWQVPITQITCAQCVTQLEWRQAQA